MAAFPGEDQTDADFFDHLVDDDDITSRVPEDVASADAMAHDLGSLSLADMENSEADIGGTNRTSIIDEQKVHEEPIVETTSAHDICNTGPEGCEESSKTLGSPGSKTNVRVVDWSAFGAASPFELHEFGSFSDLVSQDSADFGYSGFSEESYQASTNNMVADFGDGVSSSHSAYPSLQFNWTTTAAGELSVNSEGPPSVSSNLQSPHPQEPVVETAEPHTADENDPSYWEKLYPGWKYDANTNQWYMADSFAASMENDHGNKTSISSNENMYQDNAQFSVSYPQHTAHAVLETIAEESTVSSFSNWNQEWPEIPGQGYPPNMVFDPQYPGWYYDTNTGQWCDLESYKQSVQMATSTVEKHMVHEHGSSNGSAELNMSSSKQGEHSYVGNHGSDLSGINLDSISSSSYKQQSSWQQQGALNNNANVSSFPESDLQGSFRSSINGPQTMSNPSDPSGMYSYRNANGILTAQSFVPINTQNQNHTFEQNLQSQFSDSHYSSQTQNLMTSQQHPHQNVDASYSNFAYQHHRERTSAGRPAHAVFAFGFGGKLIVMKNTNSYTVNYDMGKQDNSRASISIFSLAEVIMEKMEVPNVVHSSSFSYFHSLLRQPIPGPLVGAAANNVNKWIDEKVVSCDSGPDYQRMNHLKLVLSLLKILCQHYGKLRSPYGSELSQEENDGPELTVTKLFSSSKMTSDQMRGYGSYMQCVQNVPSEDQMQATALEVQKFLVSGRRRDALQHAQEGQLWGPALVIALQLGDKYYADTVKKMAQSHFVTGSPLRTLCLLISGQPAEVFSGDNVGSSFYGASGVVPQAMKAPCGNMLDDWQENLAIVTANRTKDDELVMTHLGDCLWKERGEVIAAHCCYLVAERNFELFSESARMCLIGADHLKFPRTYSSPEAIQMTEVYEYAKVLGNPQYILLPFQPYKLIYAHMLAEMGKVAEAAKYCQASLKLLKSSGRAPESEGWKQLFASLEERIRFYQQGGYGSSPAKFVGMFFGQLDKSLSRIMGGPPAGLPPLPANTPTESNSNGHLAANKVVTSQSLMAMSSLMPSQSAESMSDLATDGSRKIKHNRSISEPDFGRSTKQGGHTDGSQQNASQSGASRLSWIGSTLQRTIGWVAKPRHEAKLGETNKFRYDEKLKRWVEEGAEMPSEELPLPPPPTVSSFQNGMQDYQLNRPIRNENPNSNGILEVNPPKPSEHSSSMPPIPPSQNQFSAHHRGGVRARYVDTFNKGGGGGGGASSRSFQLPAATSLKPPSGAKFFVPSVPASLPNDLQANPLAEGSDDSSARDLSSETLPGPPPSSIARTPSMDNIAPFSSMSAGASPDSANGSLSRNRAASWSGGYVGPSAASSPQTASPFRPDAGTHSRSNSNSSMPFNRLPDDLDDVQL